LLPEPGNYARSAQQFPGAALFCPQLADILPPVSRNSVPGSPAGGMIMRTDFTLSGTGQPGLSEKARRLIAAHDREVARAHPVRGPRHMR